MRWLRSRCGEPLGGGPLDPCAGPVDPRRRRPRDQPRALPSRFVALAGPKRLMLLPGAGDNQSLGQPHVWTAIDDWIERALPSGARQPY